MYPGLNAIRAFAFLGVFLLHANRLGGGYLGVIAFYVLSGFLITPILVDMRATLSTGDYFVRFYGRRTLRIFPLYYLYLSAVAVLALIAALGWGDPYERTELPRFIAQLPWAVVFLMDFAHAGAVYVSTPLLSHFWSLAVEEQFYLFWPLAVVLTPPRRLKWMLLGFAAVGPVIRVFEGSDLALSCFPGLHPDPAIRVYFLPFSHIDAFAIGGYFALYGTSRSAGAVWVLAAFVFGIGALSTWSQVHKFYPTSFGYGTIMRYGYQYVWGYSLVNIFFACLTVHVRDRKFMPALFENPILDYLGRISYGLYVYHFGMIYLIYDVLSHWPEIIRITLALALTIAVSAASHALFEKRFTALKEVYFARDSAGKSSLAPVSKEPLQVEG